jgi:hypothetical protein
MPPRSLLAPCQALARGGGKVGEIKTRIPELRKDGRDARRSEFPGSPAGSSGGGARSANASCGSPPTPAAAQVSRAHEAARTARPQTRDRIMEPSLTPLPPSHGGTHPTLFVRHHQPHNRTRNKVSPPLESSLGFAKRCVGNEVSHRNKVTPPPRQAGGNRGPVVATSLNDALHSCSIAQSVKFTTRAAAPLVHERSLA